MRTRVHKHGFFRLLIGLTLLSCARHVEQPQLTIALGKSACQIRVYQADRDCAYRFGHQKARKGFRLLAGQMLMVTKASP